jgi:hypothetical protein
MTKIAGSGSISQRHGSANPDPDPHLNVMDPEHCRKTIKMFLFADLLLLSLKGFRCSLGLLPRCVLLAWVIGRATSQNNMELDD